VNAGRIVGKSLTREQNLALRLGSARAQAERALLEAVQNRFDTGELGFNDTINLLVHLVADLRIESYEQVAKTAIELISEYNRAEEARKVSTAACLADARNILRGAEEFSYENSQTFQQLGRLSKDENWTVASTPVVFPTFPNP
jgi:hypothetical protein